MVAEGEPTMVNDPALAERARSLLPEAGLDLAAPMRSCGSDDFGFYGRVVPSPIMFVGLKDDSAIATPACSVTPALVQPC
jgi:amidohydrolase